MRRAPIVTTFTLAAVFSSCFADYQKVDGSSPGGSSGSGDAGRGGKGANPSPASSGNNGASGTSAAAIAGTAGAAATTSSVAGASTAGATSNAAGTGTCGRRDCTSPLDNDCSNGPDNLEESFCQCSANTTCATGQPGACGTGTRFCVFSADKALSSLGSCIAPTAGSRNCRTSADNNCDQNPDDGEPECGGCNGAAMDCAFVNAGKGVCKAGTPTRVYSDDNTSCNWECDGEVRPVTLESCGPVTTAGTPTPDTNCDGIAGNGNDCGLKVLHIYRSATSGGSCGCSGPSWTYSAYKAAFTNPGGDWTDISQFKVFTGAQPTGTVPVLNCTEYGMSYVTIGTTCPGASAPLGFVSAKKADGYETLNRLQVTVRDCSNIRSEYIPLGKPPTGVSTSTHTYFTVPLIAPSTP